MIEIMVKIFNKWNIVEIEFVAEMNYNNKRGRSKWKRISRNL